MCVGEKLTAVSEQAAGGDAEFHAHTRGAQRRHLDKLALTAAQLLHHTALVFSGDVDNDMLHGLHRFAVHLVQQHFGRGHLQLVALAPHRLDQDGKMHLAATHHAERLAGGRILHLQRHILEQFLMQAVTNPGGW